MEELSQEIHNLVESGYNRIGKELEPYDRNDEFERIRIVARKWRNLVGEARFDIPTCLHQYINWLMPTHWAECSKPSRISRYEFKIEIPGFAKIYVCYKESSSWYFHQFEILESRTPVTSTRYNDLPLFLALAREFKRPKKRQVKIEEIDGGLADNAKLIKLGEAKLKTAYVLTEMDFLNNPGCEMGDYPTPIYA